MINGFLKNPFNNHILAFLITKSQRSGQECLASRNKNKFPKDAFRLSRNFGLFPKKLLLSRRLS
ncbi:hypothetical protein FQT01_11455 [Enterococcus faecalis]|nr:hypothetical protein [Enterococcus faecalis]